MRALFLLATAAVAVHLVAAQDATDALTKVNVNKDDIFAFDQDRDANDVLQLPSPPSDELKNEIRDTTNLIIIIATDINKSSLNVTDLKFGMPEILKQLKEKYAKLNVSSESIELKEIMDELGESFSNATYSEMYFTVNGYFRMSHYQPSVDCKDRLESSEAQAKIARLNEINAPVGYGYHFFCVGNKNNTTPAEAFLLHKPPVSNENPLDANIIKDDKYTIDADKDAETVYNSGDITVKDIQERINLIQLYTTNIHRTDINATGLETIAHGTKLFLEKISSFDYTTKEAQQIIEEIKRLQIPNLNQQKSLSQSYFTTSGYFRIINFVENNVLGCDFFKKADVQKLFEDINGLLETVGIRQYIICINNNANADPEMIHDTATSVTTAA